jgi:hypothetical protein
VTGTATLPSGLPSLLFGNGKPSEAKSYWQDAASGGHAYAAHQLAGYCWMDFPPEVGHLR